MKRKILMGLPIVIGVFVLLLASSSLVIASPGSTSECGTSGCHDDFNVIDLTSDATGTIDAIQGVNFTIQYTTDTSSDLLKVLGGWANNSQFLLYGNVVADNEVGDLNSADGIITADVTFTPLVPGTLTIRAWVATTGGIGDSLDVTVTVTENTSFTTPTTTPPDDFDPIATWEFMMIVINPLAGVILILLAFIILRKTKE